MRGRSRDEHDPDAPRASEGGHVRRAQVFPRPRRGFRPFPAPCKKCRQTPILIIPFSPHFLHSPHSASRAVLRAREWIRTARVPVSERGDCFGPSAKSVDKPPFLFYRFPPTNVTPQPRHSVAVLGWVKMAPPTPRGRKRAGNGQVEGGLRGGLRSAQPTPLRF